MYVEDTRERMNITAYLSPHYDCNKNLTNLETLSE